MAGKHFAFDWIDRIVGTTNPDEMLATLAEAASEFGYSACAIATLPDSRDQNFQNYQYVRRWPPGWFEHYVSRGYLAHDPVIRRVRSSTEPFLWSEAQSAPESKLVADRLFNEAHEYGLGAGFCIPSAMLSGEQVSITFGGRHAEMSETDKRSLWIIGLWAHMHIRKLVGPRPIRPRLSDRETEVLKWVAEGFNSSLISDKLNISEATVNFHISNACRKLDVTTRTQAAVLATRLRII